MRKKSSIMARSKIVIFGLYKTGTTAVFYNIKNSLPYNPRTLFEPITYNYSSEDDAAGLLVKTIIAHPKVNYSDFLTFDKKILIVRDPRDWIISGCLYAPLEIERIRQDREILGSIVSDLKKKEAVPNSVDFVSILSKVVSYSRLKTMDAFVDYCSDALNTVISFDDHLDRHFRLFYEDFVDRKLEALNEYLGIQINEEITLEKVHGHVARSRGYDNWRSWFTRSDVEYFKPLLAPFLQHYGYESSWRLDGEPRIEPESASKYVKRIIRERNRARRLAWLPGFGRWFE